MEIYWIERTLKHNFGVKSFGVATDRRVLPPNSSRTTVNLRLSNVEHALAPVHQIHDADPFDTSPTKLKPYMHDLLKYCESGYITQPNPTQPQYCRSLNVAHAQTLKPWRRRSTPSKLPRTSTQSTNTGFLERFRMRLFCTAS